jgi:hypothetical protein
MVTLVTGVPSGPLETNPTLCVHSQWKIWSTYGLQSIHSTHCWQSRDWEEKPSSDQIHTAIVPGLTRLRVPQACRLTLPSSAVPCLLGGALWNWSANSKLGRQSRPRLTMWKSHFKFSCSQAGWVLTGPLPDPMGGTPGFNSKSHITQSHSVLSVPPGGSTFASCWEFQLALTIIL